VLALILATPAPALAQQGLRAAGRVLRGGADSTPVAGVWAVLHEVTMQGGGPLDSVRTDPRGRYRLVTTRSDSAALYMVSVTYQGVTYFSDPVHPRQVPDSIAALVVFDTSSVAPPITVAQRHVVVRLPDASGARGVLEFVMLENGGTQTRIAADSTSALWSAALPAGAADFQVGQSDVSAEAITRVGDSVLVMAPIPPGQKQIVYTYTLPAGNELRFPLQGSTGRVLVLLEDTAATLVSGPLTARGVETFEDAHFALFDGQVPAGGAVAVFRLTGRRVGGTHLALILVIVLAGGALLATLPVLLRRRVAPAVVIGPETPETLARQIAALDRTHEQAPQSPEETAAYRARRQELKQRLQAALATRRTQA
jgi:hypothetical protein